MTKHGIILFRSNFWNPSYFSQLYLLCIYRPLKSCSVQCRTKRSPYSVIYSLPVCWPSFVILRSINIWLELVQLTNFLPLKINHETFSWQLGIILIWKAFWTTTFFSTLVCIIQLSSCCEKSLGLGWQLPGKEYQSYSANRMKEIGSLWALI